MLCWYKKQYTRWSVSAIYLNVHLRVVVPLPNQTKTNNHTKKVMKTISRFIIEDIVGFITKKKKFNHMNWSLSSTCMLGYKNSLRFPRFIHGFFWDKEPIVQWRCFESKGKTLKALYTFVKCQIPGFSPGPNFIALLSGRFCAYCAVSIS